MSRIGFAIVGCGEIALKNAQALAASGAASLRWAVDPNRSLAEDLARRYGARSGAALAEALSDPEVGAVLVSAPHDLHAPLALEALSGKRHVIVEKPLARTAQEARTCLDAARTSGVTLAACYPMRFFPETIAARQLLSEGALGRLDAVVISEQLSKEMPYWFGGVSGRSRSSWRASREKSGGGVLIMNLCHHLDRLLDLSGERVERVFAEMDRRSAPGDVEDVLAMTLRLTGGAIVAIDAGTSAPGGGESRFLLRGEHGQIALDAPPRFLTLRRNAHGPANRWCALPAGSDVEARAGFFRSFVQGALSQDAAWARALEQAYHVQEIMDAAYESARTGRPVTMHSQVRPATRNAGDPVRA
jgi:predicted dehydrogenase